MIKIIIHLYIHTHVVYFYTNKQTKLSNKINLCLINYSKVIIIYSIKCCVIDFYGYLLVTLVICPNRRDALNINMFQFIYHKDPVPQLITIRRRKCVVSLLYCQVWFNYFVGAYFILLFNGWSYKFMFFY